MYCPILDHDHLGVLSLSGVIEEEVDSLAVYDPLTSWSCVAARLFITFWYIYTSVYRITINYLDEEKLWSNPGSNRGPPVCETEIITTRPFDRLSVNCLLS
jgi:hypothetical protein